MVPEVGVTLKEFPIKAVECYGEVEFSRLDRKLAMFRALSTEDRNVLPEFEQRMTALATCIETNANLLSTMARSAQSIGTVAPSSEKAIPKAAGDAEINGRSAAENPDTSAEGSREAEEKQVLSREVRRGFALLARDWSSLGKEERTVCYEPLIDAVESAYTEASRAMRSLTRSGFRVLVPGAGAGRLPWELVRRGFVVEGCEMSFTALLVGNYVLNSTSGERTTKIYPFAHEHSNVRSSGAATRPVEIPDVNPKDIPHVADFAIRAANFVEAYDGQDNSWDAVASCMAFDLSDAVIEHVRRVSQILKPGGVWTFVGPIPCLDGGQVDGIHISVEEFMGIVRKSGFKMVRREQIECLHSADPQSLRAVHLKCPFVVAVKVRPATQA